MPTIYVFDFDDENLQKITRHGVTVWQLEQVLDNGPLAFRNRRGRRGLYLVIGETDDGQCIAAPVEPTHDPVRWRPITAWYCKRGEAARLWRR